MTMPELLKDFINSTLNKETIIFETIDSNNISFSFTDLPPLFHINCYTQYSTFNDKRYYYDDPQFPHNLIRHIITVRQNWRAIAEIDREIINNLIIATNKHAK